MNFPIIRPIAIKTKNKKWYKKIWIWLSSVRQWEVMEDYYFHIPDSMKIICVPKKFIFDGASIPKWLWPILNPLGILFIGSIFHDYGYKYEGLLYYINNKCVFIKHTRKELDKMFCFINEYNNDMIFVTKLSYYVLRIFGWIAWNKHRQN